MMNADLNRDVLNRMVRGKPLDSLGLGLRNGRLDLRGLVVPEPTRGEVVHAAIADYAKRSGVIEFNGARWKALDFSGSQLNHLMFSNCVIEDCVFDKCECKNWGLWTTTVTDTSFCSADLRNSALGAVTGRKRNSYRCVNFTRADFRRTAFVSAEFVNCQFNHTKLAKVDFQGSTFAECSFEGELREVMFYRQGFEGETLPPNEMVGVDFGRARLHFVAFRNLDLDSVVFPHDTEHLVVNDYPQTIERLLQAFRCRCDVGSKGVVGLLVDMRKWAGSRQCRGVFAKSDIVEAAGEAAWDDLVRMVGSR